jgi:tetratricopeptide (TPR) repeat protein
MGIEGGAGIVPAHLRAAEQYHRAGRLAEAEKLYRDVLKLRPSHAVAQHYLALCLKSRGELDEAERLMRQSIKLAPREPSFPNNLGNLLLARGDNEDAARFYRDAISLKQDYPEAHYNLGIALKRLGDTRAAQASFETGLSHRPAYADALIQLGVLHKDAGEFDRALTLFDRAVSVAPKSMEAHYYQGLALVGLKRDSDAVESFLIASKLNETAIDPIKNAGHALLRQKRTREAVIAYDRWVSLAPDDPAAHGALATAFIELRRPQEAIASAERALALAPDSVDFRLVIARAQLDQGETEEALTSLLQLAERHPGHAQIYSHLGNTLKAVGRREEALAALRKAVELNPQEGIAYLDIADSTRFSPGDPLIATMETSLAGEMPDRSRAEIEFALGKAFDDLGDVDTAFEHFRRGNAIRRASLAYDELGTLRHVEQFTERFAKEMIERNLGAGSQSDLPIFIIGMPRSGTTLVEQILASHPDVEGGGERLDLSRALEEISSSRGLDGDIAQMIDTGGQELATTIGNAYIERVARHARGAKHLTDKMPGNFLLAGVIALALPRAKIIHCMRDPVDTCLSCYMKLFDAAVAYSYDLNSLGLVYRAYHRLMNHWRHVLPQGSILDVQYEDVVADIDTQARRIIDFCDLPWDDRCLSFHETTRMVRTASVSQVREKIYSRAVQRWKRYEKHLIPLFEALGDLAPQTSTKGS